MKPRPRFAFRPPGRYPASLRLMALVGCPFCREIFTEGEATACPVCGVPLGPIEKLPPSYEARVAQAVELSRVAPEDRRLPLWYWKRGRGVLTLISLLGVAAFFFPWVEMTRPDELVLSGYDLARARGSWFFGGFVGWLVMLPLVLSRRTVYKMRGVRIITGLFAAINVVETAQLLLMPPSGGGHRNLQFEWGSGLHATLVLGMLGVAFAARFGGRTDDIDARELVDDGEPDLSPDHAPERTLH